MKGLGTELLPLVDTFAPGKRASFRRLGDINMDGIIDNSDVAIMQAAYGQNSTIGAVLGVQIPNPLWNTPIPNIAQYNPLGITILYSDCDLNGDGKVNILDVTILSSNFGKDVYTWMGWPSQDTIIWGIVGGGVAGAIAIVGGVWMMLPH